METVSPFLGKVLPSPGVRRIRKTARISVDDPGSCRKERRADYDIPGAIRSTVTPMLIADVVKVRLERERKIGAVLESIRSRVKAVETGFKWLDVESNKVNKRD